MNRRADLELVLALEINPHWGEVPSRVYFKVCSPSDKLSSHFDPGEGGWAYRSTDVDWDRATRELNELQDTVAGDDRLVDKLVFEGTYIWQFAMPALWASVVIAADVVALLDTLTTELQPARIWYYPVRQIEVSNIWRRAVLGVGAKRSVPVRAARALRDAYYRTRCWGKFVCLYVAAVIQQCRWQRPVPWTVGRSGGQAPRRRLLYLTAGGNLVPKPGAADEKYDSQLSPLLQELGRLGWDDLHGVVFPSGIQASLDEWRRYSPPNITWHDLGDQMRYSPARRFVVGAALRRLFQSFVGPQCQSDGKLSIWSLAGDRIEPLFRVSLPEWILMLDAARRTLHAIEPSVVLMASEMGVASKAFTIEADRLGIPTVALQHGSIFPGHSDYTRKRVSTSSSRPGVTAPRVTCVWGPGQVEALTKHSSYPPDSVVATGPWRYDEALTSPAFGRERARALLKVPEDRRVVLLATSGQNLTGYVRAVFEAFRTVKDGFLLVKCHRTDPVQAIRQIGLESGVTFTVVDGLIDALLASDVVLTPWSTVAGEAMLLHRPVVLLNFQRLAMFAGEYAKSGVCHEVRDAGQLSTVLARMLNSPKQAAPTEAQRSFLERYFGSLDGRASARVAAVIEECFRSRLVKPGCGEGATGERMIRPV